MLVLAAVISLFAFSSAAKATSTRYTSCSILENMVNADPGEDPHLKVVPGQQDQFVCDSQGQTSTLASSGDRQGMLHVQDVDNLQEGKWHFFENPEFRMIMQMFVLTLRR